MGKTAGEPTVQLPADTDQNDPGIRSLTGDTMRVNMPDTVPVVDNNIKGEILFIPDTITPKPVVMGKMLATPRCATKTPRH